MYGPTLAGVTTRLEYSNVLQECQHVDDSGTNNIRVCKTESKLEDRSDVVCIKTTIVDQKTFREIYLRRIELTIVGEVEHVC